MSVEDFLNRVEATGLISPALMTELRKRVSESSRRMRPEMIAKLLVDREELTAAQARKLVMDTEAGAAAAEAKEDILTGEPIEESTSANDDLGLADTDEIPPPPSDNDDLELVMEDDTPEALLVEEEEPQVAEGNEQVPVATVDDEGLQADGLRDLLDEPLTETEDGGLTDLADQGTKLRRRGSIFSQLFGGLLGGGKSGPRTNRWDSPLILLGGGGLILLVGAGFGIFALLYAENVDELFEKGESAYQSQSYAEAIQHFERLSTKYPQDKNASMARVKAELARLRKFTDGSPDWSGALAQAQQGLPKITSEEAMPDVRAELAKLLPDIASGLVEQSNDSNDLPEKKQILALAEDSLELVHDPVYLPTSVKQTQELRIDDIEANLDVVRRDIERAEALAAAAKQIREAANDGRVVEAYRLRDDLVAKYPILTGNPTLNDALSSVVEKELAAVKLVASELKPEATDHPPVSSVQLVLSDRRGETVSGVSGRVFPILARGAVYGMNASDGKVMWRRFVGYQTNVFPQVIPNPTQDFLVVDAFHGEVQRVASNDGKLKWRLACPPPIARPLVVGNRAFICCGEESESRLLSVDVDSGQVLKEVRFPVGCVQAPGLLADGKELVQLGTHSSIYVLNAESLACSAVIPSGHRRGRVVTPPVALGDLLLIAENVGSRDSQLQRYAQGSENAWTRMGTPIRLGGRVVSTPLVSGRRLMATTDLGEVRILEAPLNSQELRQIATVPAGGETLGRSFSIFSGSQLWIADQKLIRYQLQATRGKLVTDWIRDEDDVFQNPLYRFGNSVFSTRRRTGMLGVTVAAHSTSDGLGDPIWETDLAVPNRALVSSTNGVYAVTDNGAMFPVDAQAVAAGVTDRRMSRIDPRLLPAAFSHSIGVGNDIYVFAGPPPNTHYVLANLTSGSLSRQPLRIDADIASTELVSFGNTILVACETGPIHCLNPLSGKQVTSPFVPKISPGSRIDWLPPAHLEGPQFIAAERSGQFYSVVRRGAALIASKESQVPGPIVAGLAGVGDTAYAVSASAGVEELIALKADLTMTNTWPLKQGVAWGPRRIGSLVFVSDGENMLHAMDGQAALKWSAQLDSPLVGAPLLQGNQTIVATTNGSISVLDESGQVIATQQLVEPLGGGPVAYKGRLLVLGWDGTLFLVDIPK